MAKSYNENEIRNEIRRLLHVDVGHLYQSGIINYQGRTKNTKQLYTEVAASEILNNIECLDNISIVPRTNQYRIASHQSRDLPDSNRKEEIIAITMLKKSQNGQLCKKEYGKIFDYQVPLKRTRSDKGVGKIDLVSISEDRKRVFLLELKKRDSKESMLRCVLEAYTYAKQLDFDKFKKEYSDICDQDAIVIPAPLVFVGEWQFDEYYDGKHPFLHMLMKKLGNIEPFFITEEDSTI